MFGDIAKAFGRTFLLAHFGPAAIFVVANVTLAFYGMIPSIPESYLRLYGDSNGLLVLVGVIAAALLLAIIQTDIVRLYEGYEWKKVLAIGACSLGLYFGSFNSEFGTLRLILGIVTAIAFLLLTLHWPLKKFHRWRCNRIQKAIDSLPEDDDKRLIKEYELCRQYPPDPDKVMPTRLGNILRAFESYPTRVYEIEAITTWFRLSAVIPKEYREQIADAESTFQAMLNLSFVVAVIAIELFVLPLDGSNQWLPTFMALLLSYVCYHSACVSARREWGEYVRASFDLYRLDVFKQLGIMLPEKSFSISDEHKLWQHVQLITFYNEPPRDGLKFVQRDQKPKEKSKSPAEE